MLRPSALHQLLNQVTGQSIQAVIIATRSGEFLDYVLKNQEAQSTLNIKNLCAIICSIYQSYQKFSVSLSDQLNFVIIDCDMYRLAIRPIGNHLVCICADSNTGLGILKLKLSSLSDSLSSLLNFAVYSQTS
jgi:predicted regulator of Ras-like GTPase activity (Roadblock/LC7/MglB family)